MLAAGFSERKLVEVDILKESDKGFTFDTFKDRIMFPFFDVKGNINGFTGRWLTTQPNSGKYVNTGDTPLFKKVLSYSGYTRHVLPLPDMTVLM